MSAAFTPEMAEAYRVACLHAMESLKALSLYADPEELLAEPEDFGGTDDGVETLSMAYDNMKFAAARGLARAEEVLAKARGEAA